MNWRTSNIWLLLFALCSASRLFDSLMLSIAAQLAEIAAGLVLIGYALYWIWKHTLYQDDNFKIVLNDHPLILGEVADLGRTIIPQPECLTLLNLASQNLTVIVFARYGFNVKKINLRFFNRDMTSSRDKIQITELRDCFRDLEAQPDGCGGMEGEYQDINVLARGEGMYFTIKLIPTDKWSGVLSFRAQDDSGFRSYGRYAIATGMTYEEAIKVW